MAPSPQQDLAGFVAHELETGAAEGDPYGYAMAVVGTALAFALDDGINGAMSQREFDVLKQLARTIAAEDPMSYDQFLGTLGPR